MQTSVTNKNVNRIKKLSGQVVDQIAAGEVIERPAQLIKELVENSLDAHATKVELSVSSGLSQITITDNGHGILKEDLPLVFERHSTSKLSKADELFSLDSFGFRGEALSAIGSVSKISLESRSREEDQGSLMIWDSGQQVTIDQSGISEGTKLSVSNLFDNTPARKKFLKSQRYEMTLVKKVFNSFALVHFDKEFKFMVDGKLSFLYQAVETVEKRYEQIYKKKVYKIAVPESEYIKAGSAIYLEEPGIESKTSQSLWIYVQSRWIEDKSIHAATRDGLNTYLMHGCQPKGLVDLRLQPDFVDVNVHPMKSQVRYQDSSYIYKAIRSAVSSWAALAPWSTEVVAETSKFESKSVEMPVMSRQFQKPSRQEVSQAVQAQVPFEFKDTVVQYKKTYGDLKSKTIEKVLKQEDGFEPLWSNLMVIGQVNLTYIVAQSNEAVFFIDQHAAHERVGYEKLLKSWKENQDLDIQTLLMPLHIEMEDNYIEALLTKESELSSIGIYIEQGGPGLIVLNALPGFLKETAVDKALRELADSVIKHGGGSSVEEVFELFFATVSCHSVIRAGHAMSAEEMRLLLLEMDKYRSNFCPHGRPVYKKVSFQSLDRDFGRLG
ncbi:MAG: DNA mismatch repair endonuclease MutL [Bdellovibrionales bacterium]